MDDAFTLKYDLAFSPPLLNGAGSLGFAPDSRGPVDLASLGAFITHPVSLLPRSPAQGNRFQAYPGGFLLHTGYPNPGLRAVIRQFAGRWALGAVPVLVHLLAGELDEIRQMVRMLEGLEGVAGIELGLPVEVDGETVRAQVHAAAGELPVLARLPFEQAVWLGEVARSAGAAAVSLAPPRGLLSTPQGHLIQGRLYGPALFPQALEIVRKLAREDIPVVGAGGVYQPAQVQTMLAAGALAVQVDAALWRGAWWQKTEGLHG